MTESSSQEPTMEEILASIRRIISEDDAAAEASAPAPAPEPTPEPEPEPVFAEPEPEPEPAAEAPLEAEDEILELTERYEPAPEVETIGDLDVAPADPGPAAPAPAAAVIPMSDEPLVDDGAAATAASAFAGLAASLRRPEPATDLPVGSGTSLEALVGSLLRPMLKEWLDANLPGIVEEQVRKEVERIARSAG
jgi:cell pole-organizing protein PopZ